MTCSRVALIVVIAAWTSALAQAVKNCAECPAPRVCLLESPAEPLVGGQASVLVHFCNFDKARAKDLQLAFSLKLPVDCDPQRTLLPNVTGLEAQGPCPADNCPVRVNLDAPLDWAIAMKHDAGDNLLQAKIAGQDEVVPVGLASAAAGAAVIGGDPTPVSTCSRAFNVTGSRLSRRAECNVAQLCIGKPADAVCAAPFVRDAMIDHVSCTKDACTGVVAFNAAMPCPNFAENTALIMGVKVGNTKDSNFKNIATLVAPVVTKIADVSGVNVGSSQLVVKSDATCLPPSASVNVSGLVVANVTADEDNALVVNLSSPLGASLAKKGIRITVSQCGSVSKPFEAMVDGGGGDGKGSSVSSSSGSGKAAKITKPAPDNVPLAQKENTSTGLPGGLYIGIGVGVIAAFGFIFECVHHKRRHSGPMAEVPGDRSAGHAV